MNLKLKEKRAIAKQAIRHQLRSCTTSNSNWDECLNKAIEDIVGCVSIISNDDIEDIYNIRDKLLETYIEFLRSGDSIIVKNRLS